MKNVTPLADHLAPDSIARLERAAQSRFEDAKKHQVVRRNLSAVYFFGFSVEMCVTAAYFRAEGFSPNAPIDRLVRQVRMSRARQLLGADGKPLMSSDPHPIVGWARLLRWQRSLGKHLSPKESDRLQEIIDNAELTYKHWRPELRYKTVDVSKEQAEEVQTAASWFIANRGRL